jgi:hypothetical protein
MFSYTLYDSRGRIVAQGNAIIAERLAMEHMEKGMYLLHILSSSHSGTYRIIKQ